MKSAKEELLKATQDERKKEATTDLNKDKIRDETAVRIHKLICKDTLPTPRTGTRVSQDELAVYENEIQTLSKENRNKLTIINKIKDKIEKVDEEETRVREELNGFTIEAKRSMDL